MISFKSLDRLIGIICTLAGSVALVAFHRWMIKKTKNHRGLDHYDDQDYAEGCNRSSGNIAGEVENAVSCEVEHFGSCHCEKTRFRILAPRTLKVIEKSSKIRYPRVSIPADSFELLSDEKVISMYPVQTDKVVSVHTFCSLCGVNILFSPTINPVTVEINIDCLDRTNIDDLVFSGSVEVCSAVSCASFLEYHQQVNFGMTPGGSGINSLSSSPPIGMDYHGNIAPDFNNYYSDPSATFHRDFSKGIGNHAGPSIEALRRVQDYLISEFASADVDKRPLIENMSNVNCDGLSMAMRGSQDFLSFISPAKKSKYFEQAGYANRGNGDNYFHNHFNPHNYSGDKDKKNRNNSQSNGQSLNYYGSSVKSSGGSSSGSSSGGSDGRGGFYRMQSKRPTTFNDVNDLTNRFINAYNANTDLSNITTSGSYGQSTAPMNSNYPYSSQYSRQDFEPSYSHSNMYSNRGPYNNYNNNNNYRGHFDDDSTLFSTIATLGTSQNESFWKNRSLRDESLMGSSRFEPSDNSSAGLNRSSTLDDSSSNVNNSNVKGLNKSNNNSSSNFSSSHDSGINSENQSSPWSKNRSEHSSNYENNVPVSSSKKADADRSESARNKESLDDIVADGEASSRGIYSANDNVSFSARSRSSVNSSSRINGTIDDSSSYKAAKVIRSMQSPKQIRRQQQQQQQSMQGHNAEVNNKLQSENVDVNTSSYNDSISGTSGNLQNQIDKSASFRKSKKDDAVVSN